VDDAIAALVAAVKANDTDGVRQALERHPDVKARLNEPMPGLSFDSLPLLTAVHHANRQMIEVLLGAGADINAVSHWWAGGFGVLDGAEPSLVPFLLERGAVVGPHAAARLGMLETLETLVSAKPELVHARGGDGQTPLHFASTVEIARLLVDRGADMNAQDIDHESTPAQYMVRDRQDVARFLVSRGCRTDILLAAALGDIGLVREHLDRDPASIHTSVSERYFPKQNPRAGGTIYIWTLGAHKTPHVVAREFGHDAIVQLLMDRSPAALKLAVACELGDETVVAELTAATPNLAASLADEDRGRLVDAAQNNNARAVRLMLSAGWPVEARGQSKATPLHWAAFHGNLEMVREILRYGPEIDARGDEHDSTPLGWALWGSVHGWHSRTGDYAGTVEALLWAGAEAPELTAALDVTEPVRAVLRRYAAQAGSTNA
jgi:ankyrin repeat protein